MAILLQLFLKIAPVLELRPATFKVARLNFSIERKAIRAPGRGVLFALAKVMIGAANRSEVASLERIPAANSSGRRSPSRFRALRPRDLCASGILTRLAAAR